MTSFTKLIKPDSTELERYFLSVYTGNLWDALEKIKDWHSPEHIEKEVQMKLLKLQQQALPVVPECVAKTVELLKNNPESSWSKLCDSLGEEGVTWLNEFQHKDERFGFGGLNSKLIVLFHLAINGYTVEKPQLFYLKNKLTTSYLALDINTGYYEHWGEEIIPKLLKKQGYKLSFTQAEIDSMETGSYEQIEVTE